MPNQVQVNTPGGVVTLDTVGTKADGATMPTGGYSTNGWLSGLYLLLQGLLRFQLQTPAGHSVANEAEDALKVWLQSRLNAVDDVVGLYAPPASFVNGAVASVLTGTSAADVIAAPGSGLRLHVTELLVWNDHATVSTRVEILSGATVLRLYNARAVDGGGTFQFPVPLRLGVNEALRARCATTGASVYVAASGYTAA